MADVSPTLTRFLVESLGIEGIHREPTDTELRATAFLLSLPRIATADLCDLQRVYAPDHPLRSRPGMDVRVGGHAAPRGGRAVLDALDAIVTEAHASASPWHVHVAFEHLHPFMDGNGRTGRALWAWHMQRLGENPFALPFLHRFYYQTLSAADRG